MLPELSIRTRLVNQGRSYSDLRIRARAGVGKTKLFSLKPVRAINAECGQTEVDDLVPSWYSASESSGGSSWAETTRRGVSDLEHEHAFVVHLMPHPEGTTLGELSGGS